ncbi:YdeI/OmpD-associated family protein [Mucilaginibacter myungsuensis]|uniref:YdeI/OmpD-associated family protein n=1 Tax=Mucilaginibacter myungsuensis TaxID=649104 RepID=A0A929PX67_9SPHI|nr:YdeI/OmpD-associated family protein [Mucilaginibacter myungsuensis]
MDKFEPRVDEYIAKSAEFAQPILEHVRELIHQADPGIVEVIKWGCPHFDAYGGPVAGMAAFKQHIGLNFWKTKLMDDPNGLFREEEGYGGLGKITSLEDLPADDILIRYFRNAIELNKAGKRVSTKKTWPTEELAVPDDLIEAFKDNVEAMQNFQKFSPSAKKDYLVWLAEAKTESTRLKRLETMLEWVSEGKKRHWKYEK